DQSPSEEDDAGCAQAVPRALPDSNHCKAIRGDGVRALRRRQRGDEIPEGASRGARRLPAYAPAEVPGSRRAAAVDVRPPAAKLGRARDLDDDGVRADAWNARTRQ